MVRAGACESLVRSNTSICGVTVTPSAEKNSQLTHSSFSLGDSLMPCGARWTLPKAAPAGKVKSLRSSSCSLTLITDT